MYTFLILLNSIPNSWFRVNWATISFTKCKDTHLQVLCYHYLWNKCGIQSNSLPKMSKIFNEYHWKMVQYFKNINRAKFLQFPYCKKNYIMGNCTYYRLTYQVLLKWKENVGEKSYQKLEIHELGTELHRQRVSSALYEKKGQKS